MKTAKIMVVFGALLICLFLSGAGWDDFSSNLTLPDEVREFAEKFIYLVKDGEVEKVKELLHPEVLEEVTDRDIERITKSIGKEAAAEINSQLMMFEENEVGAGYILTISVEYEKASQILMMVISDIEGDMRIVSLSVSNEGEFPVFLGSGGGDFTNKLYEILGMPSPEMPSLTTTCAIFLVFIVLSIIQIVAMWKVYENAGEPGWAVLIPIYNMYVLARVGDKPEWMGILAALSGFIPFVGPIVGTVLYIMISMGVADAFDKGIFFGLGLCFLPFIFYPILAFGSAGTAGPAPERRDFSGGAGRGFYAPPEPVADVAPAPAPIPMPPEPVKTEPEPFGPKPIPLEPEAPKEAFIRFTCSCGKRFKVPLKLGGKIGKCPQCQKRIKIPDK